MEYKLVWSGDGRIPAIGERVDIKMNGIGPGVVEEYFCAPGSRDENPTYYIGVAVRLDKPWFNGVREIEVSRVYGRELDHPVKGMLLKG